jgi:hypothetical protein
MVSTGTLGHPFGARQIATDVRRGERRANRHPLPLRGLWRFSGRRSMTRGLLIARFLVPGAPGTSTVLRRAPTTTHRHGDEERAAPVQGCAALHRASASRHTGSRRCGHSACSRIIRSCSRRNASASCMSCSSLISWSPVSRFFTDAIPESPHAHRITRALRRFSPKNQSRKSGSGSSQKSPRKPALTVVGQRRMLVVDAALASIQAASASASVRSASLA